MILLLLVFLLLLPVGCTTSYMELEGECVIQEWILGNFTMRKRMICDLPPNKGDVIHQRPMKTNPFPGLLERNNDADSTDPNLLEKKMGYPQEDN